MSLISTETVRQGAQAVEIIAPLDVKTFPSTNSVSNFNTLRDTINICFRIYFLC